MGKAFSISVQKPCSEKYEDFGKTEKGGFCTTCQKEVIDFSIMSEMEIINYFSNNNGELCGRFRMAQLKTYRSNKMRTNNNLLLRGIGIMSFSLLSLCAVSNTLAQEKVRLNTSVKTETSTDKSEESTHLQLVDKYTVKGTVLDEENLPLAGVNVVLKGTRVGTQTDFDGKFEFPKSLEANDVLVFSYLGYETKKYKVAKSESEVLDITIIFDAVDVELMGEVVVGGVHRTKRNIFQKFIALFK
ncbi:carboxypeptidase-like regulatory domain-containing protein [Maribacter sp. 2304DJ31-5]|uniref:carboxypeptidase-like regulatory domain-containing protein n=1 Tax=Maribacter sp. 2304DJ31-5 TaxID=3386273 RepID=UPI0039BD529D